MSKPSVQSALCLIPVPSAWEPFNKIRRVHDKSYVRWMPHVNILYPFVPEDEFSEAASVVTEVLQKYQKFNVSFKNFKYFSHGKSSCTIWAEPEFDPPQVMDEIANVLVSKFDGLEFPAGGNFCPHLSVGQCKGKEVAESLMAEFQRDWSPLSFEVASLQMIARSGFEDPFHVRVSIPIGNSDVEQMEAAHSISEFNEKDIPSREHPPGIEPRGRGRGRGRGGGGGRGRGRGRGRGKGRGEGESAGPSA